MVVEPTRLKKDMIIKLDHLQRDRGKKYTNYFETTTSFFFGVEEWIIFIFSV